MTCLSFEKSFNSILLLLRIPYISQVFNLDEPYQNLQKHKHRKAVIGLVTEYKTPKNTKKAKSTKKDKFYQYQAASVQFQ